MSTTKITPTHEDYDDIHDAWVENGRPSQFDREGSFGGAVYHVLDTSEDEPDFYIRFSRGATEIGSKGRVTKEGWHLVNKDYLSIRAKIDHDPTKRTIKIEPPEFP